MTDWILVILIVIVLILLWVMIYDTHRFVIRKYEIRSSKVTSGFRIVLVADLHSRQYGKDNEVLIREIRNQKPDIICIAGDLLTAGKKKEKTETAWKFLKELAGICPIYYVNGNHEQRLERHPERYGDAASEYAKKISEAGVKLLRNFGADWDEKNVCIYGTELPEKFFRHFKKYPMEEEYLNRLQGKADPDKFNLLLAHNPDYFPEYAKWGADLCLTGHVHGGLMRLPFLGGVISPSLRLFPKYDGGEFEEGNSRMILSRGLGAHTLPIRIFNPGELVVTDVLKNEGGAGAERTE